jgi:hypothetical protein
MDTELSIGSLVIWYFKELIKKTEWRIKEGCHLTECRLDARGQAVKCTTLGAP